MKWNFFRKGDEKNMFEMEKMGRKIAQLRKNKNMTQSEFADELGISFQAVSNWERGNTMPDISKLKDIARIFDVTLDELFDNNENRILKEVAKGNEVKIENKKDKEEFIEAAAYLKPEDVTRIGKFNDKSVENRVNSAVHSSLKGSLMGGGIVKDEKELEEFLPLKIENSIENSGKVNEKAENKNDMNSENKEDNGSTFDIKDIIRLAPFMNSESLKRIVIDFLNSGSEIDKKHIISLPPSLRKM